MAKGSDWGLLLETSSSQGVSSDRGHRQYAIVGRNQFFPLLYIYISCRRNIFVVNNDWLLNILGLDVFPRIFLPVTFIPSCSRLVRIPSRLLGIHRANWVPYAHIVYTNSTGSVCCYLASPQVRHCYSQEVSGKDPANPNLQ